MAVYTTLSRHLIPNLFPDEMFYGRLSQNFAWGHGLTWRGTGWGLPPLWPIVLSVAWHFGSVPDGYAVARFIDSLLLSSVVFPVWFLARTIVGDRLALVPAALCLVGPWMISSEFMASENLAFPLATACLAFTVFAVRDTRLRWVVWSLVFAVLAALTRTQMLALFVVIVVALVLDVVRQPAGARAARAETRPRVLWAGLLVAVAALLLAFIANPDLTNYEVLGHHASVGHIASAAGRQVASTVLMVAVIPVAAAIALMCRRANWRDDRVGPLLVTTAAAAIVLIPLVARFTVWATPGVAVERYTMYLSPLFLVALVAAPGRVGRVAAVVAGIAIAVIAAHAPATGNALEQPALFATQTRLDRVGLFAVPVSAAVMFVLATRRYAVAFVIVAALMITLSWTSQSNEISIIEDARPVLLPAHLDWVDRAVDGPVALLSVAKSQPWRPNLDLYTEFFNRKVRGLYSTLPVGNHACDVGIDASGRIRQDSDGCAPLPRYLVVARGPVAATLANQRVIATSPRTGTLVQIPRGTPRVLALVARGQRNLQGTFYLDRPARLTATFGKGAAAHRLRRRLPAGQRSVNIAGPAPLASVYLDTSGNSVRVY